MLSKENPIKWYQWSAQQKYFGVMLYKKYKMAI